MDMQSGLKIRKINENRAPLYGEEGHGRRALPMIEKQSCRQFSRGGEKSLVCH